MPTNWSKIAAKNCPKTQPKGPNHDLILVKNDTKKVEEIPDYWSEAKFDCNWKTVEQQVSESYQKAGQDVPISVYGRPGLLDKYKK